MEAWGMATLAASGQQVILSLGDNFDGCRLPFRRSSFTYCPKRA